MSDIRHAELGDIYIDNAGYAWEIVATCHEPTITAERLYRKADADRMGPEQGATRMRGGISGYMWDGWKKVTPEKEG